MLEQKGFQIYLYTSFLKKKNEALFVHGGWLQCMVLVAVQQTSLAVN